MATDNEEKIRVSLSKVSKSWTIYSSKSLVAFCHFIFAEKDPEAADLFIHQMLTGEKLAKNDPAYVLRERVRESKTPLNQLETFELIIRAWNAVKRGQKTSKFQIMNRIPEIEG